MQAILLVTTIVPSFVREMGSYSLCNRTEIYTSDGIKEDGEIYNFIEIKNDKLFIVQNGNIREFSKVSSYESALKEYPNNLLVSIDFADWVAENFYKNVYFFKKL